MGNKSTVISDVAKGTFSLSVAVLLTKILGMIYKIPLSYILGDEGMGYFNAAYTIYGIFYIVSSAGLPKAVTVIITENINNEVKSKSIYKYLLMLSCFFGLLLAALFFVLSPLFSIALGSRNALISLWCISPSILFIALSGIVRGYLNAKLNLLPIAISQVIEGASKLIVGLGLAIVGKRLLMPSEQISGLTILGITLGSFFSLVFMLKSAKTENKGEKTGQRVSFSKKETLIRIFKIAAPITLSSALVSIGNVFDLSIISSKLGSMGYSEQRIMSLYGNYTTLAVPMINLVVAIVTPISVALLPKIIGAKGNNQTEIVEKEFSTSLGITAFLSAPCSMAYYFYSFEILDILFDSSSASVGAPLLSLLAPSAFLISILTVLNTSLEGLGRIKLSVFSMSFTVLFKMVFSIFTVGNPSFGILGIPISTTASYILGVLFSLFFVLRDKISPSSFLNHTAIPFFISLVSFCVPFILYYKRAATQGTVILLIILSGFFYIFITLILGVLLKNKAKIVKNAQLIK